jgi:small subunit ribosomal protein S20
MPILKHAKKALRASEKKTEYNQQVKSRAKTTMDAMRRQPSAENMTASYQAIDKAAKRNVFHANKAARLKSQMAALLK